MEILKKKELIGEEMRRLEGILNVGLKLEREEVMGGEYRQQLHKLQNFHRKQAQVSRKIINFDKMLLFEYEAWTIQLQILYFVTEKKTKYFKVGEKVVFIALIVDLIRKLSF